MEMSFAAAGVSATFSGLTLAPGLDGTIYVVLGTAVQMANSSGSHQVEYRIGKS